MRDLMSEIRRASNAFNPSFKLPLILLIVAAIDCSPESALSGNESIAATAEAPATSPQESATPEPAAQTYSQKLAAALEKATAAKDAVVDQFSDAGTSGSQAASDSIAWATEMFNSLKNQGITQAENTQQWLSDDWKQAGAWEYHVVTFISDADIAAKLNELGKERWECFQVVPPAAGQVTKFYFKRPAQSYLNNLPMKDLMHLLPLMGSGGDDGQ
jgi:hypothetical protein